VEAFKNSPYDPCFPESDPFFFVSLSSFSDIRDWPLSDFIPRQFMPSICLQGPIFGAIMGLALQDEGKDSLLPDMVSKIYQFCARAFPLLSQRALTASGYSEQLALRNDLLGEVLARAQSEFQVQISTIVEFMKLLFVELPVPSFEPPALLGRISEPPQSTPAVLRRASFLSGFCARNLERVKPSAVFPKLLSAGTFSKDANLTCTSSRVPVAISDTPSAIILRSEDSTIQIKRSKVTDLYPLNESTLAIIADRVQYLLDFSPLSCHHFLDSLVPLPGLRISPGDNLELLQTWTEMWVRYEVTSFEYLCIVNFLSGRAFNGDLSMHPIFPSTGVDFRKCNNCTLPPLDGHFKTYESPESSLLAPPEMYFFPQMCGSFEKVYANRKALEDCDHLEKWLTKVFGTKHSNFLHKRLFQDGHPARADFRPPPGVVWQVNIAPELDQRLAHCFGLESGGNAAELVCVSAAGLVTFGRLSYASDHPTFEQTGMTKEIGDVQSAHIASLPTGIAIYRDSRLTVLTPDTTLHYENVYLKSFVLSGGICQISETELCRFSRKTSRPLKRFTELPARILCFASSARHNITAVACDDSKLRIRSNVTGRKVATIAIEYEFATSVTITPSWGMIVVKTLSWILVYDVNGFPVTQVQNSAEFLLSSAFQTRNGFDFVAYQDADFNCFYFEAADPAALIPIEMGDSHLVCITHDWLSDRFTLVANTGKVLIVSRHCV
jgi:hypothetical protein